MKAIQSAWETVRECRRAYIVLNVVYYGLVVVGMIYVAFIPIRFVDVELDESLRIADALHIYAYDAYLIRCALKYNSPLVTLDKDLIRLAKQMDVSVIEVEQ